MRRDFNVETGLECGMGRATQLIGGKPDVPGKETLPRRERLTSPREYREVFDRGRRTNGQAFVCYVARSEGQGRKFGMAVSRQVGGAVIRNRVKRFIRETYRKSRARLREDVRMVVVAKPAAARLTFAECHDGLTRLLRQGGAFE
jgi:ribonuclease P protein component